MKDFLLGYLSGICSLIGFACFVVQEYAIGIFMLLMCFILLVIAAGHFAYIRKLRKEAKEIEDTCNYAIDKINKEFKGI